MALQKNCSQLYYDIYLKIHQNTIACVAADTLVCIAVVNGLNNFQVGFPVALPTEGSAVNTNSYDLCGAINTGVPIVGLVITIECASSTQQYRYVIVQSLDTSAEELCIAELAVYEAGIYAITFTLVHQYLHMNRLHC